MKPTGGAGRGGSGSPEVCGMASLFLSREEDRKKHSSRQTSLAMHFSLELCGMRVFQTLHLTTYKSDAKIYRALKSA